MLYKPAEIVEHLLPTKYSVVQNSAEAFAPTNIALIKYWGKRNKILNLPQTSSLSISLGEKGTNTRLSQADQQDIVFLNNVQVKQDTVFYQRLINYLNLFRPTADFYFNVATHSNIPIEAGLASSASGFAALVKALNIFFDWQLPLSQLSILARLGSGSACRSLWDGFVLWHCGEAEDGLDSFAQRLDLSWPEICVGLLMVNEEPKKHSSRDAMNHTVETSPLYPCWPAVVEQDLIKILDAIKAKDFATFGQIVEGNACAMHATMLAARPSIIYYQQQTLQLVNEIQQLRKQGVLVYFTQDAGPNLKLLFLEKDREVIERHIPSVKFTCQLK